MILAGDNCGNPWHGLWSPDGLLLPNSDVMLVSPAPVGGGLGEFATPMADRDAVYPSAHGDSILVRVPGLPVPETSAAETAAGMAWKNYALLGGARRLLHGVPLGMNRWIYIDPNGKPWLAELRFPATSGQPRVVRFREFGVFRPAPTTTYHDYTFGGVMTLNASYIWEYEGTAVNGMWLADSSARGAKATVALLTAPVVWDVKHLDITGVPGVDLALATPSPFVNYEPPPTALSHTSGPLIISAGSVYYHHDENLLRMYDGETPLRCVIGADFEVTDVPYVDAVDGASTSGAASGDLVVICGANEFRLPFSTSMALTYDEDLLAWVGGHTATVPSAGFSRGSIGEASGAGALRTIVYGSLYLNWPIGACPMQLRVWRRTNNVFEVELVGMAGDFSPPMASDEIYSVCLVLPDRIIPTGERVKKSDEARYFSYHPITTELTQATTPRCYL